VFGLAGSFYREDITMTLPEQITESGYHMLVRSHGLIKATVGTILANASQYEWTLQGLGMLRIYLGDKDLRLHVWDDRFAFPAVSEMHTHPWDFESYVVAGIVENYRFKSVAKVPPHKDNLQSAEAFMRQSIFCGVGGGLTEEDPEKVWLVKQPRELYRESDIYTQKANEIHVSVPRRGTVTIVRRHFLEDEDHAYVFWPHGEEWVSAEPREATPNEVESIARNALATWFSG
jgi:hypothetical protein